MKVSWADMRLVEVGTFQALLCEFVLPVVFALQLFVLLRAVEAMEGRGTLSLRVWADTLERVQILRDLRLGVYDVIVGINLLREGIDLPEVTLVAKYQGCAERGICYPPQTQRVGLSLPEALAAKTAEPDRVVAYRCRGHQCEPPFSDPAELHPGEPPATPDAVTK